MKPKNIVWLKNKKETVKGPAGSTNSEFSPLSSEFGSSLPKSRLPTGELFGGEPGGLALHLVIGYAILWSVNPALFHRSRLFLRITHCQP
jgi:hypothetical protein